MPKYSGNTDGNAVGIIEEAFHLLRLAPIRLFLPYYLGSLPFILGFLYFWGDMSRNPFAAQHCSAAAFGLAILFVSMKCMHSVFAIKVYERATQTKITSWSLPAIVRLVSLQAVIQASGFVVLPIALLITIPYPWAYAFYQNALMLDYRENMGLSDIMTINSNRAVFRPRQNLLLMLILSLFNLFVLINLGIAVYSIPHLIKMVTGIESAFTMGGFSIFNSTFIASVFCLTYLCVDPLIKTVYVLRGFYAESVKTGSDLKADLQRMPTGRKLPVILFFIILPVFFSPENSIASEDGLSPAEPAAHYETGVSPDKLSKSIDDVMNRKEFTWRMPEVEPKKTVKPGLLDSFFEWIAPYAKKLFKMIKEFFEAISEFLEKFLHDNENKPAEKKTEWGSTPKYLLFSLLILSGLVLLVYAVRVFLSRRKKKPIETEAVTILPDIIDEDVRADDLPPDQWIEMAMELAEKGDFRLAMRALYLGTLAKLAENSLITIAGYKSNREYQYELTRRAHEKKPLIDAFRDTVGVFDRVWYGMYRTGKQDLDLFAENQKRIATYAK